MPSFDPNTYGPAFAPLLMCDRRRPLNAGTPDLAARAALESLSEQTAFAHARIEDSEMAECCIAGVWLLHDFLEESHTISQGIETPSGSYWHSILHRREGDYSNAKYWLRRVGPHPVFDELAQRGIELAAERGAERAALKLSAAGGWDPLAFVDLCQSNVTNTGDTYDLCLDIQQAEWELLFGHCYNAAILVT
jgi:hypothetical protein